MGSLTDAVLNIREQYKIKNQQLSTAPVQQVVAPVQSLMPQSSISQNWERTMGQLMATRHVIEWLAGENEGLYTNLVRLEGLCRTESKMGKWKEYDLRKRQYLSALGKICELYYQVHGWKDMEILSPGLGMKKIVLCLHEESAAKAPSHCTVFLVREFPFLVTFDRDQILFACAAKEGIPGSTIHMEL